MGSLTKRDLVIRISNETGMIQQDVLNVIQRTLDHLTESLSHGQDVELRNFGVFEVTQPNQRGYGHYHRNNNRVENSQWDGLSRLYQSLSSRLFQNELFLRHGGGKLS